jgi:hypothetical protein
VTSFRGTPASSSAISWAVAPAHDQTTPSSTINSHTTCLDATASTQVFSAIGNPLRRGIRIVRCLPGDPVGGGWVA